MPGRRPIGPVDTIWLNMDRPDNLMVIDGVMWFDEPVDWDRARRVLGTRLVGRFPVFSQRPVEPSIPLGLPSWEDDPDFDLDRHIIHARLPAPGDDAALQAYVEEQIPRPFDRRHPLWEYHFIDGYRSGAAIMSRFHHSLADGAALTEVLLSTTDDTPDGDLPGHEPRPRREPAAEESTEEPTEESGPVPSFAHDLARGIVQGVPYADHLPLPDHLPHPGLPGSALLGAASWMAGQAGNAARGALHLLSNLPQLANPHTIVDVLSLTQQTGQVTGKLLLAGNPPTPLAGVPAVAKRVVWSQSHRLDDVKQAGRLAGATVNDVLVSAVSDTLARYMRDRGADPVDLVTMVPVNLRKRGEPLPRELGNKFALVFLQLPSGDYAPLERLALAKRRMDDIKRSPEAVITFGMISAIGRTNPDVERVLVDYFSNKSIGVTTNVPGPREPRYLAGTPLKGVLGWVPGSGRQGIGVCILTYGGTVQVGFKVDAGIVPDPEKLVHAFDESIDDLLKITGNHGRSR